MFVDAALLETYLVSSVQCTEPSFGETEDFFLLVPQLLFPSIRFKQAVQLSRDLFLNFFTLPFALLAQLHLKPEVQVFLYFVSRAAFLLRFLELELQCTRLQGNETARHSC